MNLICLTFYFQSNLLASGGSESEIYLWDLNNPVNPMTPGSKSQVIKIYNGEYKIKGYY